MAAVLDVLDLHVSLRGDGRELLRGVSLEVGQACMHYVLGLSGSGKTLVCNAVLRTLDPHVYGWSGRVLLEGEDLLFAARTRLGRLFGEKVAYIPQDPVAALDPSMRVGAQLAETLRAHRRMPRAEARRRAIEALAQAGLPDAERAAHSYPYQLSGGMCQRALFAMACMMEAALVVADEPTTALDAQLRAAAVDRLDAMRAAGSAVLMVTHDFRVARRTGGTATVLEAGAVVEEGPVRDLIEHPASRYTAALVDAMRLPIEGMGEPR